MIFGNFKCFKLMFLFLRGGSQNSKFSQNKISNFSQIQKSPNYPGRGRGSRKLWTFPTFWDIFGPFLAIVCVSAVSTPQHGQNITILFVCCEVHSNTKLLGYGKHMVNVWFFWDIRTLNWPLKVPKMAIFEPLLDACTPQHGQNPAVLNEHSKVYSMDKDLSYGKLMVTMG